MHTTVSLVGNERSGKRAFFLLHCYKKVGDENERSRKENKNISLFFFIITPPTPQAPRSNRRTRS